MKTFLKSISLIAALASSSAATAAGAPSATSLDQLLDQVRNASQQNAAVNQQREQEFKAKYDQQAQILATAQQVLQNEQARSATLQASYDKNVATSARWWTTPARSPATSRPRWTVRWSPPSTRAAASSWRSWRKAAICRPWRTFASCGS
jgi:hypothetical protein